MTKKTESIAQPPHALLEDLRSLVTEAEKLIDGTPGEHAEDALGALRARFEAAQSRLGELYADTRQKVVAGAKCTDAAIRAHPYQSLVLALGAGLLVGVLLGRRSR
ncbi:MAG: DUF883 family protein [Opitutaceae bacterium]|nr:DUF883 family protein [Opitutaceae bacterium]